jgi:hypothetical protein
MPRNYIPNNFITKWIRVGIHKFVSSSTKTKSRMILCFLTPQCNMSTTSMIMGNIWWLQGKEKGSSYVIPYMIHILGWMSGLSWWNICKRNMAFSARVLCNINWSHPMALYNEANYLTQVWSHNQVNPLCTWLIMAPHLGHPLLHPRGACYIVPHMSWNNKVQVVPKTCRNKTCSQNKTSN